LFWSLFGPRLGSVRKKMNGDQGFYQLPHICDYLLSAAVTPGRQSFRRRQQRLPKRQQKQQ